MRGNAAVPNPSSLWRQSSFVRLVVGQAVSQTGSAVTTFVLPWLLLERTGSAAQAGLLFAAGYVPYILMALPAGVWADWGGRKSLMVAADAARLCLVALVPMWHLVTGSAPVWTLYGVQMGLSGLSAIFDAAYTAAIPNVVPEVHWSHANRALQLIRSLSRIAGPVIGGLGIVSLGAANTLWLDTASYVVSIVAVLMVTAPLATAASRAATPFAAQVREGVRVVWQSRILRRLVGLAVMINLVGPGMDIALLYRLQHVLRLDAAWASMVLTGLSAGMALGALTNARVEAKWGARRVLRWSTALQVLPPLLLAMAHSPLVMVALQFAVGVLLVAVNVQTVTLRQQVVPDAQRGRSGSVFRLCAWVSIPIGDGIAGWVSQHWGTPIYFLLAAGVLLLAVAAVWRMPAPSALPVMDATESVG